MLAWELSCEVTELLINASSSEAVVPEVLRSFKMQEENPVRIPHLQPRGYFGDRQVFWEREGKRLVAALDWE